MPFTLSLFYVGFVRLIFLTFYFSNLCSKTANSGIISSIFTTNVVFSTIIFYFVFGEKLSGMQIVGIMMVIASVFMVSYQDDASKPINEGGPVTNSTTNEENANPSKYLFLSILCAVSVGLCLGFCALIIRVAV